MVNRITHPSGRAAIVARAIGIGYMALAAGGARPAGAAQVGDVFYIAMENHNFAQPGTYTSTPQIQGNAAAPYINSLITPGNANAAQVSYASNYTNAGVGEHPSEPNYIWSEAGTNFNPSATGGTQTSTTQGSVKGTTVLSDSDPTSANGNLFSGVPHLTAQLNGAGISWKNYQEDLQYTSSPQVSASGTTATANPYFGTGQYAYAAKHNPMAFFADTATQNVSALSQLSTDLTNNAVGKYNWITPDLYNDMHTALGTNLTYNGTTYTAGSNAEAIAQGDHFLSVLVPQIMASAAYRNNGAIVIWFDEAEGGDSTAYTIPEIVISPLAKGNAYNSTVALSHTSDLKTIEELNGLAALGNAIPTSETSASGTGYNAVASSNDLSSLFVSGAVPAPEPTSFACLAIAGTALLGGRRRRAGRPGAVGGPADPGARAAGGVDHRPVAIVACHVGDSLLSAMIRCS